MRRTEVQEERQPSLHVLCLAGRSETFVWPSHISVSLHLSTPQSPHISLPGVSERRSGRYPSEASFPIFAPVGRDRKMWKEARCSMAMRPGVVRDGYFHWRAKTTE